MMRQVRSRLHPPPPIHAFGRDLERREKARDVRAFSMHDAGRRISGGSKRRFWSLSLCRRNSRSWCQKAVMRIAFAPELSSARCVQIFEFREAMRSGTREREPLKLHRPFGRRIAQGRNADAARQATPDGSLDQSRCDERH